jgi:hypothetical protein
MPQRGHAGSPTISASTGVAIGQINQLWIGPNQTKNDTYEASIGCAVTYIVGTIGT